MALAGKICLVTGASRGIGKGIALQLGEAGATVYITGRSGSQSTQTVGGSLKETAEEINSRGGKGIPVVCDHKQDDQVKDLFEKIQNESGRLDVLVNNAYSAVKFIAEESAKKRKFWQYELEPGAAWDEVNRVGLRNHYICSVYAVKMMMKTDSGLIVNISSAGGLRYLFNVPYGVGKAALDRMGADMAVELSKTNITVLTLWPGAVQTEMISDYIAKDKEKGQSTLSAAFDEAESCEFSGKGVVGLALDKNVKKKAGKINIVAELAQEYGFDDDGSKQPSMRQLNYLLRMSGWKTTASYVPDWLKLPKSIFHSAGNKF